MRDLDIEKVSEKISTEIAKLRKDYPCKKYYINEGVFDNDYLLNDIEDDYWIDIPPKKSYELKLKIEGDFKNYGKV